MLVPMAELLRAARAGGYAIGAFNTYNLEITRAIVRAAEMHVAPVILAAGVGALRYAGQVGLAALLLAEARAASVPVVVHLDHAADLSEVATCVELGFTSVMIDGSRLPFADNVALTRSVVAYAADRGVSVEAELGAIVGDENRAAAIRPDAALTDPAQAAEFVAATGVDALAVAVGNVHGFYQGAPRLDSARLAAIADLVGVPLVIHGSSGLPDAAIREAIGLGVAKFNLNTELRVAFVEALAAALPAARGGADLPRLFEPGIAAMQRVVEAKLALFGSAEPGASRGS